MARALKSGSLPRSRAALSCLRVFHRASAIQRIRRSDNVTFSFGHSSAAQLRLSFVAACLAGTALVGPAMAQTASQLPPVNVDSTRLRKNRRVSLTFEAKHTDAILQRQRTVRPDPDLPFDAIGNITGLNTGTEIDPALSAIAGQTVVIAPVPGAGPPFTLADVASGANTPRLFN